MEKKWFAIRTKPRKESYARDHFERQGFEAYLPQTLMLTSHARKKTWTARPFFPGYLFLELLPEERCWSTIAGTYGAIGAVCFGTHYPPVPDEAIYDLKAHEDENGVILCDSRPGAPFRHDQRVRIVEGPMKEFEGVFKCMSGRDRVLVLIEFLRRSVSVQMPLELVAGL